MSRTPFLFPAVLVSLVLAAPAHAQAPPPLGATLAGCNAGPAPTDRFALFTGSMPAMAGTARMAIRFDLLERRISGRRRWHRVAAPRFGRWQRSKTGRSGFVYTKRIERLRQGFLYRADVRFRWYDADGALQREARRRTPVCHQPDQRPDLEVESFSTVAASDGETRYVITVVNNGRTAAGPFEVGLTTPERDMVRSLPGLAARERTTFELRAPACREGEQVQVQVDVTGTVDEANERNNRSLRLCGGGR